MGRIIPTAAAGVRRSTIAVAVAVVLSAVAAAAQTASDSFAAATAAFNGGDFARALELFELARSGTGRAVPEYDPALEYNIAVCHYKLENFVMAEAAFAQLSAASPQFHALAEYNRGLALLAQERREEARQAFEISASGAEPEVAALAQRALDTLAATRPALPATARARWLGFADVAGGYDDNVSLADELPGTEPVASAFAELYAYASRPLETSAPSRIEMTGYVARYPEAAEFDQSSWRVAYALQRDLGSWRLDAGPNLAYTALDGDGFERQIGLGVQAVVDLTETTAVDLRYNYDDIADLSPQYSFIDGRRESVRLTLDRRGRGARVRVSYGIERNDRAGLASSAERNRFMVRVTRALPAEWRVDAWGSYRRTERNELAVPVDERLAEWSVTANRAIAPDWIIELGYYGADNDSDAPYYAYERNRMSIGVSKEF